MILRRPDLFVRFWGLAPQKRGLQRALGNSVPVSSPASWDSGAELVVDVDRHHVVGIVERQVDKSPGVLHGDGILLLGVEGSEVASISGTAILAGSSKSCAVQSHLGYPLAL